MPAPVLESLQNDLVDYRGRGLSVLEMSHRSNDFAEIAAKAEKDLRTLLAIPSNYSVLFMQGGASAQFALCVQNLDICNKVAYANTGYWSQKAIATGALLTSTVEVASCTEKTCIKIPDSKTWLNSDDASFLHITDNETINGVVYDEVPEVAVPLVADMSSSILSQPVDVSRYGMIYAGAQKNIGPAGITVLIVRDDLLERSAKSTLPPVFNYAAMAKAASMLNTPPTFAWYAAGLVFEWLLEQGGLDVMAAKNMKQARQVYDEIDKHATYKNWVHPVNRSRMNIPFSLANTDLTAKFLKGSLDRNFIGLKGHKSVGGLRASVYNAATDASVGALVDYLGCFARENS
ncbi:MAG: phosphoserine aminotransferase [bacterium]|jgi:phosphoserine aminotransferase